VSEYNADHSHWNSNSSLGAWLASQGIPALCGIDTRALTKKIREHGAMLGKIEFEGKT
jgi:carbamoylphosphate synthase small subunit